MDKMIKRCFLILFSAALLSNYLFYNADVVFALPVNIAVETEIVSGGNQVTFTATDNGSAVTNVQIYIDGELKGITDSNGILSVSALTTNTHNWQAEYIGGTVGSGKFSFYGYGIRANGTESPPISFSYEIKVTGSSSGIWGYDAGTSGEYQQCFIDTPGIASGCYYKCRRREVRVNLNYGITFDSNPSISISSTGYDPANPHVGSSPYCSVVEERPDGCIIRSYIFYVGYNVAGGSVKRWIPGDNALFSCSWSGSKRGNNSVSKNDTNKYIDTISSAQVNDVSLSLIVNGISYEGTTSVDGGGVRIWLYGQELRATYAGVPIPWSQSVSGVSSVKSDDIDKTCATFSMEAPDGNTTYALEYITSNGNTVYDDDEDNVIEYQGLIAWMQGQELHASMSYHPPIAIIDSISPKLVQDQEEILFIGHGEEKDAGDFITEYKWRSHLDGVISASDTFTTNQLSAGSHIIYFQVADSTPYVQPYTPLWSPEVTENVVVNIKPNAYIRSIKGTGVDALGNPTLILGDSMTFNGVGIDIDGDILGYEWRSNISGVIGTSESFSVSDLPIGYHTISFRVRDSYGEWSEEITKEITVRHTPVIFVTGFWPFVNWSWDHWGTIQYLKIDRDYDILDPDGSKKSCNVWMQPTIHSIYGYANVLSNEIEALKRNTGAKKIDIVSHSMGGLISRWYAQIGYKNDVRKLITIASPHHGAHIAKSVSLFSEGASQMEPHSPFLKRLNDHNGCATTRDRGTDDINHSVEYSVFGGEGWFTPQVQHWETFFGDFFIPWFTFRGDVAVSLDSTRLDNVGEYIKVGYWHLDIDEKSDVLDIVKNILRRDSATINNTMQDSIINIEALVSNSEIDPQDNENDVLTSIHSSEPISDTIHLSGIKSHSTLIEPNIIRAIIDIQSECKLDLTLITPDGTIIDASHPDITYTQTDNYISFEIPYPEPGIWTLEVTEPGLTDDECRYTIRTFMETDLFVGVGTEKEEYKPNDPIKIYAYVKDNGVPVGTADVAAKISKTDGLLETISLFDDGAHDDGDSGDGIYANVFKNSSESGAYNVSVNAIVQKNGDAVARKAQTTFWVQLLPDLSVTDADIAFSNNSPEHGEMVTITATIHNIGDADASEVKVLFFDGDPAASGIAIGEANIDLSAGNETDVSVPWKSISGVHTIHVIISPFNDFLEDTYDNNRASAVITVTDTEQPVVNAGPDQVVRIDRPVFFDGGGSADNAGITQYSWDIDIHTDSNGDGIPDNDEDLTGVTPVYGGGYDSIGSYVVKLTVNDVEGNGPVSDTLNIAVTSEYDIEKPAASAGPDQTVALREPVYFDASQSSDNFGIASYQWDIDVSVDSNKDGITDNDIDLVGARPVLVNGYCTSGDHTIKMTVDDVAGNGPVSDTMVVSVINSPPTANANGPYFAHEGDSVLLVGAGSGDPNGDPLKYRWDFDNDGQWDTQWSTMPTIHHTWPDNYAGTARLEITDGDLSAVAETQVTISNVAPVVEAGDDKTAEVGEILNFSGFLVDPGEEDTHIIKWDFGDGSTANGNLSMTHSYETAGVYQVSLVGTDDDGESGMDTVTVTVTEKISPRIITLDAAGITTTSAVLYGRLDDLGAASSVNVSFKWGTDSSYGHETTLLTLTNTGSFNVVLTGLNSNTTYHFRAKAAGSGISYGEDVTFITSSAAPSTVWIDDDYSPDFTEEHSWGYDAFNCIQDGIDAVASAGGTVNVAPGTYYENIEMKSKVEILGSGADVTTIDGSENGTVVTSIQVDDTAKLDGFTITNGHATNGGGIVLTLSSPALSNCVIEENTATVGGGIYCTDNSSPVINSCIIRKNASESTCGGMFFYRGASPIVKNCMITDNSAGGIGGGIVCQDYAEPLIMNCTLTGNFAGSYGGGLICHGYPSWPIITNSIIWGNTAPEVGTDPANVSFCDIDQAGYEGINGNIRQDPMFVGGGDYHLTADSPCIDAGKVEGAPLDDFEGDTRPQGYGIDIGADESYPQYGALVAYYPFDQNADDLSGNGYNGTVFDATLSEGYYGQAYVFNGQNNYINIPVNINPDVMPQLTMGAWVKAINENPIRQVISHDNGDFDRSLGIDNRGGGSGWSAFKGDGVLGFHEVELNEWTFIAVVYDQINAEVMLYVNGSIYSGKGTLGNGLGDTSIGFNPGNGEYFEGVIDDVFIFDKAMTKAELDIIREKGVPGVVYNGDRDNDGLSDDIEMKGCTSFQDADTDDDGILDGKEDANHNGRVDGMETDPCLIDTDNDGIQDGTELSKSEDDIGNGTDDTIFQPDVDQATTTNPLDRDTDNDGIIDGEEDINHNGRVDYGETDPNNPLSRFVHIYLKKGFNLMAIPTDPPYGEDLLEWLPVFKEVSVIKEVFVYDNSEDKFITLVPEDNFTSVFQPTVGEGLLVNALQDSEITLTSVDCSEISLKPGFNFIGFACPIANHTAFELLKEYETKNVTSIQRFNVKTGNFETAGIGPEGEPSGINFEIVPGEGYFVYVKDVE